MKPIVVPVETPAAERREFIPAETTAVSRLADSASLPLGSCRVGAKMMGDYANFINTGHRNFIRVLIPHQILRKIRIYGFLWHPMSSSMQLWNVSPPEYLISRSKDFKTIGPDALIRPATHGGLPVGWKKIRVDRPLELLSTDGDFSPEKFQLCKTIGFCTQELSILFTIHLNDLLVFHQIIAELCLPCTHSPIIRVWGPRQIRSLVTYETMNFHQVCYYSYQINEKSGAGQKFSWKSENLINYVHHIQWSLIS